MHALLREMTCGNPDGMQVNVCDAAMADTVEWILRRQDRIVVAAHNGHVQRCPLAVEGVPSSPTMGLHLADRLGTGHHLHMFDIDGVMYGDVEEVQGRPLGDWQTYTVGDAVPSAWEFEYEYDFGDSCDP